VVVSRHACPMGSSKMVGARSSLCREVEDPTAELLLCALRVFIGTEENARLKALIHRGTDWSRLLEWADQHEVVPHLHRALSTGCADIVPEEVLQPLKAQFDLNLRRNLRLSGELLNLLERFSAQGIPALPIKGPALAALLSGNLALRQCVDLDIMVHKPNVLKAKELLVAQGYQPFYRLSHAQDAACLRYGIEYNFYRDDPGVLVEIHWRMDPQDDYLPLNMERLWEGCAPVAFAGRTVPHPPAENLLQILLVHGSRHFWQQMKWLCDIGQLLQTHQEIDWDRVLEGARTPRGRDIFYPGLWLARDLLEAPLPDAVWQVMQQDPEMRSLVLWMKQRLFSGPRSFGIWERPLMHLRTQRRLRDGIAHCLDLALTPTSEDVAFMSLPEMLFPLYYMLRPIRLALKHTGMFSRPMFGEKQPG